MRAMILAAGLGTRLAPLTGLRPKPALPVRGLPLVAPLLELLRHHGVREVMLNLHHLPEVMREAAVQHAPAGLELHFSTESQLLGTGGALRRVRKFLRESDPCLVLAGDMLLDVDLGQLISRHRERRDLATLLLRRDRRAHRFGTIGLDEAGGVRRIGRDFDVGGATREGVFVGVRCLASRIFDAMPDREAFEDLRDWLAPRILAGESDIRGELREEEDLVWEPVGTPEEYLRANLRPLPLGYMDVDARATRLGVRFGRSTVVGRGAVVGAGAQLTRAVVWDEEHVPAGARLSGGVFAGGRFHACPLAPCGESGG